MTVARRKAAQAQRGKADLHPHDALVLLTADHNELDKLVREFERQPKTGDAVEKGKAALRICHAFEVYAAIKREVFYPAAEAVLEGEDREALAARREDIADTIAKVEATPADDPSFDSAVAALAEQIKRLTKQEEETLFPRLRHSKLDLVGTGERMAARKTELSTAPLDRDTIREARKVLGGR